MNRSDIMRISALFEIALGSASLIAARFWIGTTNIVGRHVSHGDTTEAFALTYAFTLLQIAIGIIGVMNAEKGRMSTVIFGILAFIPQIALAAFAVPVLYAFTAYKLFKGDNKTIAFSKK